ncbi:peptidoglycan bridge formation glycyltransferase FemA/FemB family protein [Helicobacter rodentium]|uniref:peptidoglycan bridge formation glycyltransferase FemA/FemB family protein n=1 Tax=Helicobacter rodentium TaxID=59617 RepID=UPI002357530E|nr:peptidoglycan bridge formation glycyltransferase FemA/FemB family protein [Helicobacter rodentium]
MRVEKLHPHLHNSYNAFLESMPTMLYYSLNFKKLLEDILHCDSHYMVALEGDKVCGILPLMSKSGSYGEVLNSLPFYGSNGGIIANNMEASFILRECYNQFASTFASTNYIQNPLTIESSGILHDFVDRRLSQWTKLKDKDALFASFASSARRNIKKSLRENIKVTTTKKIDFLYQTHRENILANNGIPKEKIFFEKISKCFKDGEYKIYAAFYNDKPIAALLLFYFGGIVEYYTPATLLEFRNLQALPLLVYIAMVDAYGKGYQWWNWGGTWGSQESLYRFKEKFGAIEKHYNYYCKLNNQDILNAKASELLREYPYFYVVPFSALKESE